MKNELEKIDVRPDPEWLDRLFKRELAGYQFLLLFAAVLVDILITVLCYPHLSATGSCFLCMALMFVPGYLAFYQVEGLDFRSVLYAKKRMKCYIPVSDERTDNQIGKGVKKVWKKG